jgi:hypothetical protein
MTFLHNSSIQVNTKSSVSLGRKLSTLEEVGSHTIFTCENWVNFERNTAYLSVFSCVKYMKFVQNCSFKSKEKVLYLCLKKNHEYEKQEGLPHCFPVKIQLACERNTAYFSGITNVRNMTFLQNSCIQEKGSSTVSLERKSSNLEVGESSTFFSCEKWVSLLKEYLWFESILKWENHSLYEKYCFRWNGKTLVSYGPIQCVKGGSVLHLVSLWELSYLLKGILPTSQCFHVWGTWALCNISIEVNGTSTVSLLRKPSMWEAGGSSTMFPCENFLNYWKEHCLPLSVLMCEEHELCAVGAFNWQPT